MQGYIININRVKDEDLIVTVLTSNSIKTLYRFYGARHSTINLGYKIDFESQHSLKSSISQLRNILHLAEQWNKDFNRMYIWQAYVRLFYLHLKDIDTLDSFYFDLLESSSMLWGKQNPKRVAIESYVKLLEYEGRMRDDFICFACEEAIQGRVALLRGFLPIHQSCANMDGYDFLHVRELLENKSTLHMEENDVDRLWKTILQGL
ncbi:MAG: recombination protein RecO [Sulfurospirillaceae bacterium]|nr:recombination protein RecO [Sulfurospirillaceae bacterium]